MNLLIVEMRRAMRRRVVRVLILLALVGVRVRRRDRVLESSGKTLAELHADGDLHPAVLRRLVGRGSGPTAPCSSRQCSCCSVGCSAGAAVAGAEWRAGTITTVLTWEPRRVRLNLTRTAACGLLAFVIAIVLQMVFLASFVPAVLVNGSTAGTDGGWWMSLVLVIAADRAAHVDRRHVRRRARNPRTQHRVRPRRGVHVDGGDRGSAPAPAAWLGPVPVGREHRHGRPVGTGRRTSSSAGVHCWRSPHSCSTPP